MLARGNLVRSFAAPHLAIVSLLASCSALMLAPEAAATWQPKSNVEIVTPTRPGGGVDTMSRVVQKTIQENRFVNTSTVVVNKPGGGGTAGYQYLQSKGESGEAISIVPIGIVTNQIMGLTRFTHTDVTPIAVIGRQYIAVGVRANSPITSMKSVVDRLKKDPQALSIAVANRGSANEIALASALKAAGIDVKKLRIVVFGSGGESEVALLGGHVDLLPVAVSVVLPEVQEGKIRAIAVSSPQRLGGAFANVPTYKELGIDFEYSNFQTVIGPKAMTSEQRVYWQDVIGKVVKTKAWQNFVETSLIENTHFSGNDAASFLDARFKEHKEILTELGLAK